MAATYAHATAPLRRLADRYVVGAALAIANGQPVPEAVAAAFDALPKVMARADARGGQIERAVIDLAEAVMLKGREGEVFEAVVTDVDERGVRIQLVRPADRRPRRRPQGRARRPAARHARRRRSLPSGRWRSSGLLDPFDLLELELDRRGAAEDRDADLDAAAVEIEFLDHAVEARERAVEHLDRVADLVIDADLGLGRGGGGFFAWW